MKKKLTRVTFDCPTELHFLAKKKSILSRGSLKDYLVNLILDDVSKESPEIVEQIKNL